MKENVRVRIAPSPTGFFHVGSARTALYNWLFARHHNGVFILRIEDTDIERSSESMIQVILDGLSWLGLDWDEGPFRQSERVDMHKDCIEKLIEKNRAYYCYCDPVELEKQRSEAYKQKKDWKYDRRCLHLSKEEQARKARNGMSGAVRFLVPDHAVNLNDIVYGEVTRAAADIEDFVIRRANGTPTYNLACVVDDNDMRITHVIRGGDHLTNTFKQILLYEALEFPLPRFAHLPLILGTDKSKLSKRHGAVALDEYKEKGILPDALVNYLALLGWSPGDDREIMDQEELIERFSLERINASNAVFDATKLEWLNQKYIMELSSVTFKKKLIPFIIRSGLMTEEQTQERERWLTDVCDLLQRRLKSLNDVNVTGRYFFKDDFEYDQTALAKHCDKATLEIMAKFLRAIQEIEPFDANHIEVWLRKIGDDNSLKPRQWIHPLRVYITGQSGGPGLFETMEVIGKKRCIARIEKVLSAQGVLHDKE